MDGKIDTVREALVKLRSFAKGLDCDYQEECTSGEEDMCQSCKHVFIADEALAALSLHDEEIRRECADRDDQLIAEYIANTVYLQHQNKYLQDEIAYLKRHSAIMGKEACKTCGRQCPNDCPMDKEAGE